jgi:UPF0755 protein
MRRRLLTWMGAILLGMITAAYLVNAWMFSPLVSTSGVGPPVRVVDIPEGASFRQVATLLEKEQLIASRWGFLLLGKLTSADRRIMPGEYALHADMRPSDILARIQNGQVVLHPVTIPEGFTVAQIAELLDGRGFIDTKEFLALAHDRDFILSALQLDLPSLEGYLYPDTYYIPRRVKAKDFLTMLVDSFWKIFTPELRARAAEINLTVHQVLTLASVIEKETGTQEERELISSVFHNRLRRRIPLQSDPTVIYGLLTFDGNLKKRDLDKVTPYNTYRVTGLPPGPIANPGLQSIRAALYPAPSTYLYFVSKNNGTHQFSSTLAEHSKAVDTYQRQPVRRVVK